VTTPEAVAVGLVLALAWDTRRRWAPGELLQLVGEGESDQAPDVLDYAAQVPDLVSEVIEVSRTDTPDQVRHANERAFLAAIAEGEGTSGPDGYRTLVGGQLFTDFSEHPAVLGWRGLPLSDAMCRGAGFGPGCVSTAAGRYQITRPTWLRLRDRLGLPDFSPASQDSAALALISERNALEDVREGRIEQAVRKVRSVWASLPGAGYGQREVRLASVLEAFRAAGGYLQV
jgi:lysozyme